MSALPQSKELLPPSRLESFMHQMHEMDSVAWQSANRDYFFRAQIADDCDALVRRARAPGVVGMATRETLHSILGTIYNREFDVPDILKTDCETQPILRDIASVLEQSMLDAEIALAKEHVVEYPTDGREYVRWLKELISGHPASTHGFYHSYLQDYSTREDLRYLLAQETCLDPRFDDILALIQLAAKGEAKMELAANYWDEMGNGKTSEMHSALFANALDELGVTDEYIEDNYLFEAKVCGNLSAALALFRRHYYKAIGYYGVTEYLAPRRFRSLVFAWKRLGLREKGAHYHELHVGVDAAHAAGWFKNVVRPAIDRDPRVGRDIAIGALLRLNTSERYLDALLARTGFSNFSQSSGDQT
jgi:hypothetical protein